MSLAPLAVKHRLDKINTICTIFPLPPRVKRPVAWGAGPQGVGGVRLHREDVLGAIAVQIVWSSRKGSRQIEHLGSAHDEDELAALKAAGAERLAAGQAVLDLAVPAPPGSEPLPITSSQMTHLWRPVRGLQDLGVRVSHQGRQCVL